MLELIQRPLVQQKKRFLFTDCRSSQHTGSCSKFLEYRRTL
ncbi:hypothetical protein CLOSTMETH_03595 [[Clostridium] methylpentosum DSM 5476]|uniref:Uncharacterized protein n=1 Tax=[Clostridium] methylpentosum DSM 5476 TaxID=537013 RepID=C0EIA0_9FIRM|nr:hypothetical protein CLOSTMETH_03595 [[Clostridium] methylpentosum DSM 5476]